MNANGNGRRVWYECPRPTDGGCGRSIVAGRTEDFVAQALFVLDDDERLNERPEPGNADELGDLEQRLDDLARAYGAGSLSMDEWLTARTTLDVRLQAARSAVHALRRAAGPAVPAEPLRDRWDGLSIREKAATAADHLSAVLVGSGRGGGVFDPTRLTPVEPRPQPDGQRSGGTRRQRARGGDPR
jgi:hypothetical protein